MSENQSELTNEDLTGLEIAVIGMSGRFPGANNIEEFWEILKNGREGISFFDEDELSEIGLDKNLINTSNLVKAYGWLDKNLYFDAAFFGYTPTEAEIMDPQIRLLHECAYEALEVSGYNPHMYIKPIGLYVGASANFYWQSNMSFENVSMWFATKQLTDKDFLATRIAYKLNLRGPAITLDTACSTSLTAIHLAIQGLISGDCDMSLAGGVTAITYVKAGYKYEEGMILSSDGHTRSFDSKANGSNVGDGVGVVVLKRYSDAISDRDNILAIVKGSAINNDGNRKSAYTAPSIEGQANVIITAHQMAEVDPETITYLETHGTGTSLGDPVEIEALKTAFNTPKKHFCRIGSVKSNVGHLEMAAGVAGFIKTVLALKHKFIPPTLCFENPSPKIDFVNSPFIVNTKAQKWEQLAPDIPRRAGISSFGIGGTNVHIVLEEAVFSKNLEENHPQVVTAGISRPFQLIPFSAKSEIALEKMTKNLLEYFKKTPDINLSSIAYTLQTGRQVFPHRSMFVCSESQKELSEHFAQNTSQIKSYESKEDNRPLIFMFPGLGSQYVNMGRDLYEQEPFFRKEMDHCFEVLSSMIDFDIKQIIYPSATVSDTNGNKIDQPEISQIVTFILEYSLSQLLIHWGIVPNAMIGYSFGEYAAACISGVFSVNDALKLIVSRGQLLQQAPEGAMLSIPLSQTELESYLSNNPEISLAIDNGPSCIVSGTPTNIELLIEQLKEKKIMCMKVPANRALHSQTMKLISDKFLDILYTISMKSPQIRYISNVTGEWQTQQEAINPNYWVRHLVEPVQFSKGIKMLLKEQGALFIEIGAGRDISTLAIRHFENEGLNPKHRILNMVRPPHKETSDVHFLLTQIGWLWMYGQPINWENFWKGEKKHYGRIPLPPYPFESKLFAQGQSISIENFTQKDGKKKSLINLTEFSDWFYIPSWKRIPVLSQQKNSLTKGTAWLLFIGDNSIGLKLADRLSKEHQTVFLVKKGQSFQLKDQHQYTINPLKSEDYELLFTDLNKQGIKLTHIIHLWLVNSDLSKENCHKDIYILPTSEQIPEIMQLGYYSLLNSVQSIGKLDEKQNIILDVITNNMHEVTGGEGFYPEKSSILGPVKIIPTEYPNIKCRSIDIDIETNTDENQTINQLINHVKSNQTDTVSAYRRNFRWVPSFEQLNLGDMPQRDIIIKPSGVYLITGGLGGLGLIFAKHIAKNKQIKIVLVSRTLIPPKKDWNEYLTNSNHDEKIKIKIKRVKEIEETGAEVIVLSADVANRDQMHNIIRQIQQEVGAINGIFHCAGEADGEMIHNRKISASEKVLAPKISGTIILYELLKDYSLDFIILSSSISSILPQIGQVGYCTANAFLDAFAQWCTHNPMVKEKWQSIISINWDRWQGVGVAQIMEKQHKELTGEDLIGGIPESKGIEALERALSEPLPQVVVTPRGDINQLIKSYTKFSSSSYLQNLDVNEKPKLLNTRPELNSEYIPPKNDIEAKLAKIWENFFSIDQIGIQDDFFELGGDSLKALTILPKIQKTLNSDLSITDFFNNPTINALAKIIGGNKETVEVHSPIFPTEKKEFYKLSPAQKRLYILQQIEPMSTSYNILTGFELIGELNHTHLRNAFEKLVQIHEGLRTTFHVHNNEPIQRIHDTIEMEIEPISIANINPNDPQVNFSNPFDLNHAPLFRVGVIKADEERHTLLVDMHHIISDGTSHNILTTEFLTLYQGANIPQLKIQYKDYSEWRNSQSTKMMVLKQEEFWKNEFPKDIPILNLPTDYPRPKLQSFEGDEIHLLLLKEETDALKKLASEEKATLYMVLLTVFNLLLAKISGQDDVIVGMDVGGRTHPDLQHIIGMFVNTLPLRNFPNSEKSFKQLLSEVKEKTIKAMENQDYPFEDMVEILKVKRNSSRNPLFDVMFSSSEFGRKANDLLAETQGQPLKETQQKKLKIKSLSNTNKTAKFDISLMVKLLEEQIQLTFEYCTKLFTKETIQQFTEYFKEITNSIIKNPTTPISNIEIISNESKNQLLKAIKDKNDHSIQINDSIKKTNRESFNSEVEFDF